MVKYYLYKNIRRHHKDAFALQGTYDNKETAIRYANDLKDIFKDEKNGNIHIHRLCTIIISTKENATSLADFKKAEGASELPSHVIYKFKLYI